MSFANSGILPDNAIPMKQRVPRLLDHRYELGEVIGSGGMATVYSAQDNRLGRIVAIKVLRPEQSKDPVFRARFQREAEAVASLSHPSIVAVFDTGSFQALTEDQLENADPLATAPMPAVDPERTSGDQPAPGTAAAGGGETVPYIVMEMLHGQTLKSLMAQEGPLPLQEAEDYAAAVLDALQYSHERGIVHRDIKPANIMVMDRTEEDDSIGRASRVKVMDFGIARALTENATPLTEAQTIMGTARYIAPEQARGETVDSRSDLYAMGCVLYQMLTGRPPFEGSSSVEVAGQHLRELPQPPSRYREDVPAALDAVVLRSLEKNRSERFQSAEEFSRALRQSCEGVVGGAEEVPTEHWGTGAAGLGAAALGSGAGSSAAGAQEPEDYTMHTGTQPQLEDADVAGFFPGAQDEYSEEELYEDGRSEALAAKRRRRNAWKNAIFVLVVLLLAAAAGGAWLYYQHELNKPVYVSVPHVAGEEQQQAEEDLRNAGLKVKTKKDFSDKVASGKVIETDPEDAEKVEKDSTVTVHVSKGPANITIPEDLKGQSEAYVRSQLQDLGLKAGKTSTTNDPRVPSGMVVQTSPAAGTKVGAGSTVDLVLSTGKVAVPNVVGMPKDQAIASLTGQNTLLSTQVVEEESDAPQGQVTEQSAQAGSAVDQGSTVTITVSKGPAPSPTPQPSESSSPSPSESSSPSPSSSPTSSSASPAPSPSHSGGQETTRGEDTRQEEDGAEGL